MGIDWSKAPPHATHWCPGNAKIEAGWIYNPGGEFYSCYAEKGCEHIPDFPEWRKARLIQRPVESTWAGEGIPPVGTVCGLWFKDADQGTVTVIFIGDEVGVFKNHSFGHEQHGDLKHYSFYMVGTPEEIESQERKNAILEMTKIAGSTYSPRDSIVQRLYDAGYRKQVTE